MLDNLGARQVLDHTFLVRIANLQRGGFKCHVRISLSALVHGTFRCHTDAARQPHRFALLIAVFRHPFPEI